MKDLSISARLPFFIDYNCGQELVEARAVPPLESVFLCVCGKRTDPEKLGSRGEPDDLDEENPTDLQA